MTAASTAPGRASQERDRVLGRPMSDCARNTPASMTRELQGDRPSGVVRYASNRISVERAADLRNAAPWKDTGDLWGRTSERGAWSPRTGGSAGCHKHATPRRTVATFRMRPDAHHGLGTQARSAHRFAGCLAMDLGWGQSMNVNKKPRENLALGIAAGMLLGVSLGTVLNNVT